MALNDIVVPKENASGTFDEVVLTGTQIGLEKPATGNASSTQVVLGNDTRLSDARTPSSHAASHAAAGSDPLFDQDLNSDDDVAFNQITVTGSVNFDGALLNDFAFATSLAIKETANELTGTFRAQGDSLTANRTYDLPDASGTLALTTTAPASHTHGNLTNDGKVGSTSGLLLVTTTAGAVTTLALGTAGQVLTVNSGANGVEFAAAAGGVADGDKGDITVSNSGATWTIDANAVTNADLAQVATATLKGRSTAGTGNVEDLSASDARTVLGLATTSAVTFASLATSPAANTAAFTTTGYSLTGTNAQSLVDLSGTWNTTGTPSAIKLNVTDTASNASSLLMQLQTGGTNRLTVSKGGAVVCASSLTATALAISNGDLVNNGFPVLRSGGTEMLAFTTNANVNLSANGAYSIGWASSGPTGTNADVRMWRDSAATWALRDGTNAMEARFYGTYTSSTNYQRMTIKSVKQTLSALSGASATTTGTFIPDGAVVVGVTTRVATLLTGAAGYTIGDGTDADRWGDITGTAIGTTSDNRDWTAGTIECFTAGGEITLTAKTSNFTAGAIEICVFYLAGQAD